jgi:hypothetical protein
MTVGPYVFGDGRRHLWVAENANLTDKLKHFLPRLRGAIPNLTDIELPPSATRTHSDMVRAAGFFANSYEVAHGRTPLAFADSALANHGRIKVGGLELNFEGSAVEQMGLKTYITQTIARVRSKKPLLPVSINVVPWKAGMVPVALINDDQKLTLTIQAYEGNMDGLVAADDLMREALKWGIRPEKITIMHAVQCAQFIGGPRQITLPKVRDRGAFYIDDLLLDAGLLPS